MNNESQTIPYWRLSGFYLFYFASLGALVPYWGLYLKSEGYSALQIGELMALLMATKIISPNIWGWIADHTGKGMTIVRLGSLLAAIGFCGVFVATGYWSLALVMVVFSFFWNAVLPQFEANTLSHLGSDSHRYSSIRLWGSIGFIVAVAGLGPVLEWWGAGILPMILALLIVSIWLSSLMAPGCDVTHPHHEHASLGRILRRPEVLALLLVCFLMQASHGPYYTFYTIYLEDYGYSRSLIGQLWALGVVVEVMVFMIMHRLTPRFGLERLLMAALLLTMLRWMLIGLFPQQLVILLFAQTLHAASFGIFHAVAIALFHRYFPGKHQGRGQALYSSISFGAGGAAGAFYAGISWETLTPQWTYFIASILALLAWFIAYYGISKRAASTAA